MKNILIALIALAVLGAGAFFLLKQSEDTYTADEGEGVDTPIPDSDKNTNTIVIPGENDEEDETREPVETIGTSEGGTELMAYHFGNGETEVLFVGGVHSAFAPNTVQVMEELRNEIEEGEIEIPDNITVTIIPNLNPDATGSPNTLASRLNENGVDLNRNFDCEWEEKAVWRSEAVSGGTEAFSETEAKALRDYVAANAIAGAVVYYAADGGVYASNCGGALNPTIATLVGTYADASGYTANEEFDAYAISGDLTNWLAGEGVPAIGVLMSNYTSTEWSDNKAGIEAVLSFFAR